MFGRFLHIMRIAMPSIIKSAMPSIIKSLLLLFYAAHAQTTALRGNTNENRHLKSCPYPEDIFVHFTNHGRLISHARTTDSHGHVKEWSTKSDIDCPPEMKKYSDQDSFYGNRVFSYKDINRTADEGACRYDYRCVGEDAGTLTLHPNH